jgi:hypothetical protein
MRISIYLLFIYKTLFKRIFKNWKFLKKKVEKIHKNENF